MLRRAGYSVIMNTADREAADGQKTYCYDRDMGSFLYPVPYPGPAIIPPTIQPTQATGYSSRGVQAPPFYYYRAPLPKGMVYSNKGYARERHRKPNIRKHQSAATGLAPSKREPTVPQTRLLAKKPVQLNKRLVFTGERLGASIGVPASQLHGPQMGIEDGATEAKNRSKSGRLFDEKGKTPASKTRARVELKEDEEVLEEDENRGDEEASARAKMEESAKLLKDGETESGPRKLDSRSEQSRDKSQSLESDHNLTQMNAMSLNATSKEQSTTVEQAVLVQETFESSAQSESKTKEQDTCEPLAQSDSTIKEQDTCEPSAQGDSTIKKQETCGPSAQSDSKIKDQATQTMALDMETNRSQSTPKAENCDVILLKLYETTHCKTSTNLGPADLTNELVLFGKGLNSQLTKGSISIGMRNGKYIIELS